MAYDPFSAFPVVPDAGTASPATAAPSMSELLDEFQVTDPAVRERVERLAAVESGGRFDALGPVLERGMHKGTRARGALQIMPATASGYPQYDINDGAGATRAGLHYFLDNLKAFDGDLDAATIAHHSGPGGARKWLQSGSAGTTDLATGLTTDDYLTKVTGGKPTEQDWSAFPEAEAAAGADADWSAFPEAEVETPAPEKSLLERGKEWIGEIGNYRQAAQDQTNDWESQQVSPADFPGRSPLDRATPPDPLENGSIGALTAGAGPLNMRADLARKQGQSLGWTTDKELTSGPGAQGVFQAEDKRREMEANKGAYLEGHRQYAEKSLRLEGADAEQYAQQQYAKDLKAGEISREAPEAGWSDVWDIGVTRAGRGLARGAYATLESVGDMWGVEALSSFGGDRVKQEEAIARTIKGALGKVPTEGFKSIIADSIPTVVTQGVPIAAAAMLATIGRSPLAAMTVINAGVLAPMGIQKYGETYADAKSQGLALEDRVAYAFGAALAEVVPERISLGAVLDLLTKPLRKGGTAVAKKSAALELAKRYMQMQGVELGTEEITEVADFLLDQYYSNPDLTLKDLQARMIRTALVTPVATTALGAAGAVGSMTGTALRSSSGDLTTGGEFDPAAIDAEARGLLSPDNAQMEGIRQATGAVAPVAQAPWVTDSSSTTPVVTADEVTPAPAAPIDGVTPAPAAPAAPAAPIDELDALIQAREAEAAATGDPVEVAVTQAEVAAVRAAAQPPAPAVPAVPSVAPETSVALAELQLLPGAGGNLTVTGKNAAALVRALAPEAMLLPGPDGAVVVPSRYAEAIAGSVTQAQAAVVSEFGPAPAPVVQAFYTPEDQANVEQIALGTRGATTADIRLVEPAALPDRVSGEQSGPGVTRASANFVRALGELAGLRFAFYESPTGKVTTEGAVVQTAPDTVFLNVAHDIRMDAIAIHEVGHVIQKTMPEAHQTFVSAVEGAIDRSDAALLHFAAEHLGATVSPAMLKAPKQALGFLLQKNKVSRTWLDNEMHSDVLGFAATQPGFWPKFFRDLVRKDVSLFRKVADAVRAFRMAAVDLAKGAQFPQIQKMIKDLDVVLAASAEVMAEFASKKNAPSVPAEGVVASPQRIGPLPQRLAEANREWFAKKGQNYTLELTPEGDAYLNLTGENDGQTDSSAGLEGRNGVPSVQPQDPGQQQRVESGQTPAVARSPNDRDGPRLDRVSPTYGRENQPGAVTVTALHFSREPRGSLSGAAFGSGLTSAEAARVREGDAEIQSRINFYVDEGNGVQAEAGAGTQLHEVVLSNIYDATADSQGLWRAGDANTKELALIKAGYDGYYVPGAFTVGGQTQGGVVLVGKRHTSVPVAIRGAQTDRTQARTGAATADVAPSALSEARAVAAQARALKGLPAGQMSGARWRDALAGADDVVFEAFDKAGLFDAVGDVYLSELAGRYVQQAAAQMQVGTLAHERVLFSQARADQKIDPAKVPEFRFSDYVGRAMFVTVADRTAAGGEYTGIDAAGADAVPLQGGPNFPLLESNWEHSVVWANDGPAIAGRKANIIAKYGNPLMAVSLGALDMHKSNATAVSAYLNTLEKYIEGGRVKSDALTAVADRIKLLQLPKEHRKDELASFPGFGDAKALREFVRTASFTARASIVSELGKVRAEEAGLPNADKVIRALSDPEYAGARDLDTVLILEPHAEDTFIKLGEEGTNPHLSYSFGIKGRVVGKLKTPINAREIWAEWFDSKLAEKRTEKQLMQDVYTGKLPESALADSVPADYYPTKGRHAAAIALLEQQYRQITKNPAALKNLLAGNFDAMINLERSFGMATPVVTITEEHAQNLDAMQDAPTPNAATARAVAAVLRNDWATSEKSVKEGGASAADFARELTQSMSSATLDLYTEQELIDGVRGWKWGEGEGRRSKEPVQKMRLFKLRGERTQFALKTGMPYTYGLDIPGLSDNEVTLVAVVNNDAGVKGVSGTAIVLKALEEGATFLDAYAHKSEKFSQGFLPALYNEFGFDEVGRVPADPAYITDDHKYAWKQDGWKDGDPLPDIVMMKWRGQDADRATIQRDYWAATEGSLFGQGVTPETDDLARRNVRSSGQALRSETGTEGRNRGDARNDTRPSLAGRTRQTASQLRALSDVQLRNLGLTRSDLGEIPPSSAVFSPKRLTAADRVVWRDLADVKKDVGLDKLPQHITPFAEFMRGMAAKAAVGALTARDLVKAYTITRSSVNRSAIPAGKVRAAGLVLPASVGASVRPEGAFSYWLLSKNGQAYLNDADRGVVNEPAIANAVQAMTPFGMGNVLGEDLRRIVGQDTKGLVSEVSNLIADAATGEDVTTVWQKTLDGLYGIGYAKKGFMGALLGYGQLPTFDARQINVQVERASKADLMNAMASKRAPEMVRKLAKRLDALDLSMDPTYEVFRQHLVHHAVWDAVGNSETTHEDVIDAMVQASPKRPSTRSDGLPIHPTKEGVRAFWEWFGDSKVVDAKGRPLVVYHGTPTGGFSTFDGGKRGASSGMSRGGFSFTTGRAAADAYTSVASPEVAALNAVADAANVVLKGAQPTEGMLESGRADLDEGIYAFDGSVFDTRADLSAAIDLLAEELDVAGQGQAAADLRAAKDTEPSGVGETYATYLKVPPSAPEFNTSPQNMGRDLATLDVRGVPGRAAVVNLTSGERIFYVADSNQIKSATGNFGTFDPSQDSILRSPARPTAVFSSPAFPVGKIKKSLDNIVYQFQDRFTDLKAVQSSIEAAGRTIRDEFNPYMAETLMYGRAAYRIDTFLEAEVSPMLGLMRGANITIDQLNSYAHARHAEERNAAMAKRNPNRAELDQQIDQAALEALDAAMLLQQNPADGALARQAQRAQTRLVALRAAKPWGGTEADRLKLSGMSDADAQRVVSAAHASSKGPVYRRLGEAIDRIAAQTRAEMVAYSLDSAATSAALDAAYQHYVPLQRDMGESDLLDSMGGTGRGLSVRGSQIKRATGSLRDVENILANLVAAREATVVRGEKNRVARSLYGLAMEHPNPDLYTVIRPNMSEAQVRGELQAMGLDPDTVDAMSRAPTTAAINDLTGLSEQRVNSQYARLENAVVLRVSGEDRVILFNKGSDRAVRLVRALRNEDTDHNGITKFLMEHIGPYTRYLSAINTQYNPVFGLTNFVRDLSGAMLNLTTTEVAGLQTKLIGNIRPSMVAAWNWEQGRRSGAMAQVYQEFLEDGASTGFRDQYANLEDRAKTIERDLGRKGVRNAKGVKQVLDMLSDYNTAVENATRLAAYKTARDAGMSRPQAANLAKDITVNFNRKGARTGAMASLYAFFNSAVQGTERTFRVYRTPLGKKLIAGGVALGAMQTVLGILALGDDWDEIPEFERAKHLFFPMPWTEQKYIKIPMPLGHHAIPNVGRFAVESLYFRDRLGDRALGLLETTMDAFNPVADSTLLTSIAPSVADPLIHLASNTNAFGRKIEREDFSALAETPGWTRGKESTGAVFHALAYGLNWASTGGKEYEQGLVSPTPETLSYLYGVASGGLGREIEKVAKFAANTSKGDAVEPYNIPIASRFYGRAGGDAALRSKYYTAVKEINAAEFAMKRLAQDDKGAQAAQYEAVAATASASRTMQRVVSDLHKAKRLEKDPAARKRYDAEVLEVQKQLVEMYETVK